MTSAAVREYERSPPITSLAPLRSHRPAIIMAQMLQLRWNLAGGSNAKIRAATFNPHKRRKKARDFHAFALDANKMVPQVVPDKDKKAASPPPQAPSSPSPEQQVHPVEAPASAAARQQWTFLPLATPSSSSSSPAPSSGADAAAAGTAAVCAAPMAHVVVGPRTSRPTGDVVVACAVKRRRDEPGAVASASPPPSCPPAPAPASDLAIADSLKDHPELTACLCGSDTDAFSVHEDTSDHGGSDHALEFEGLETESLLLTELLGPPATMAMDDLCGFDGAALEAEMQSPRGAAEQVGAAW